jgi:Ca2+-binding RTX toxin-like protein
MNLQRMNIVIGATALLLTFGSVAFDSADVDAKKHKNRKPKCEGVRATIVLKASQNGAMVHGTAGNDVVVGTKGVDIFSGDGGSDRVCLGDGQDIFYSWAGGGGQDQGGDTAYGGKGNDTLIGEAANDKLYAGEGNDNLSGGAGADLCDGGQGSDKELVPGDCETLTSIED